MHLLNKPKHIVAAYCLGINKLAKFAPTMKYEGDYVPEAEGLGRLRNQKSGMLKDRDVLLSDDLRRRRLADINYQNPTPIELDIKKRRQLTRDTIARKSLDRKARYNLDNQNASTTKAYNYLVNTGPSGYKPDKGTPRLNRNPIQAENTTLLNLVNSYNDPTLDPNQRKAILSSIRSQEESFNKLSGAYSDMNTLVQNDLATRGKKPSSNLLANRLARLEAVKNDLNNINEPVAGTVPPTAIPPAAIPPAPSVTAAQVAQAQAAAIPAQAQAVPKPPAKSRSERVAEAFVRGQNNYKAAQAKNVPAPATQTAQAAQAVQTSVPTAVPTSPPAQVVDPFLTSPPVDPGRETIKDIIPKPVKRGATAVSNSVKDGADGVVNAVKRINPLLAGAGLTAIGAGGLLLGGSYLSNKRQQQASARQQELNNVGMYQPQPQYQYPPYPPQNPYQ